MASNSELYLVATPGRFASSFTGSAGSALGAFDNVSQEGLPSFSAFPFFFFVLCSSCFFIVSQAFIFFLCMTSSSWALYFSTTSSVLKSGPRMLVSSSTVRCANDSWLHHTSM